jgi:hypothetical protein
MQDLLDLLKKEAGLTEEQASKAIVVIKNYAKEKVPPMFAGTIEKLFNKYNNTKEDKDDFMP